MHMYCLHHKVILSFYCRDRDRDRRSPKRDFSSRSRMRSDEIEEKRKRLRSDEGEEKRKSLTSRSKKREQEERLTAEVKVKEEPRDIFEERMLDLFHLCQY